MKHAIRIVSASWLLIGVALCAWAFWGLAVQDHDRSVVASWLAALIYGALAVGGALLTYRLRSSGRYLLAAASLTGLLYVFVYFLFGGLDDAASYLPGVVALSALSAYTLFALSSARSHAT